MKNFNRSVFLVTAGLGQVLSCYSQQGEMKNSQHPNIILIVADDMGWKDLECYGNSICETPNINKLANESVMFTNAYAAAPVSSPTRASIMTGKFPARLHMTTWSEDARDLQQGIIRKNQKLIPAVSIPDLPLEEFTIAEALKKQGYNAALVGKWHLGESMFYPENQGFDINIGGGSWGCPSTYFYPYKGPFGKKELRYIPHLEESGSGDGHYFKDRKGEYLTDRLTDEAIKIMKDGVEASAPFFLDLSYYAVHKPIEAPDSIVKYYKNKISGSGNPCNPVYAAMVHNVDQNVGRILSAIQELGISDCIVLKFVYSFCL